jgi:hypothetical protein
MPDLRLTPLQFQRLFGLLPMECGVQIDLLVKETFLTRTLDGLLVRAAA